MSHRTGCISSISDNPPQQADIAAMVFPHVCNCKKLSVETVKSHVSDSIKNGIKQSYEMLNQDSHRKFWSRVKEIVTSWTKVPFGDEFKIVRSYLKHLKKANAESQISYELTKDKEGKEHFGRLALMFKSQVNMVKGAKPVISLDAGFMKNVQWGSYQVMVCAGQDGNNRDLIFAIALVPVESESNYKFLLDTMKRDPEMKAFLEQPGLIVTTDRKKGLMNAVKKLLPASFHRFCALHLLGNIKGPKFGELERKIYWDIVFSDKEEEFTKHMEEMKKIHPIAYNYLSELPPECWANYACPGRKWGHVCNNLSERAVKFIGSDIDTDGLSLPIIGFIELFIRKFNARIRKLRDMHESDLIQRNLLDGFLNSIASKNLDRQILESRKYGCRSLTEANTFGVWDNQKRYDLAEKYIVKLDFENKSCSCQCLAYGMHGMGCKHIFCALQHERKLHLWDKVDYREMFFHPCYYKENLTEAYSLDVKELFNSNLAVDNTEPPIVVANYWNNKFLRAASSFNKHQPKASGAKVTRCGHCSLPGHTVTKCKFRDVDKSEIKRLIEDIKALHNLSNAVFYDAVLDDEEEHVIPEPVEVVAVSNDPMIPIIAVEESHGDVGRLDESDNDSFHSCEEDEESNVNERLSSDDNIPISGLTDEDRMQMMSECTGQGWADSVNYYLNYASRYVTKQMILYPMFDGNELIFSPAGTQPLEEVNATGDTADDTASSDEEPEILHYREKKNGDSSGQQATKRRKKN